jgi:spore maturation protein CgeB
MNKENIIIGVHGAHSDIGGRYNMLASFSQSLLKAFRNSGVQAYSVKECAERQLPVNMTIGCNVSGYETWDSILSQNIPNVMWNGDSIFYQNMEAIEKYGSNPNFVFLSVTPCDEDAIANYFPQLKRSYLPSGVDLDLWKYQDCEKEIDVVYFSAMYDYEAKLIELSEKLPPDLFSFMLDIYEIVLTNPSVPFWDVAQIVKKHRKVEFDKNQYQLMFHNLIYIIDYARRVMLVQSLSKFNLKLYGGPAWKKYISGNIEYMGECDVRESVKIMNKSKIVMQSQPLQLCSGLNERVLNSSAVETFVVSSDTKAIISAFGDNCGYYNSSNFEDVADKVNYYLTNDEERIEKAKNARKIVQENHTIEHRAQSILTLLPID